MQGFFDCAAAGFQSLLEPGNITVRISQQLFKVALLALALGIPAFGQGVSGAGGEPARGSEPDSAFRETAQNPPAATTPAVMLLEEFRDSTVKFDLEKLMDVLRDRRHEGWVLAAYPDPKTSRPLIGAGFSLDLPAREHPQSDPLNPHPFLEPSSAELWQAAGLNRGQLQRILDEFEGRASRWSRKRFRHEIKTLPPEISEEDAMLLLRVAAVQAIYNAKAYCRNFDELTASQQMALSQLVYQMGVNLEEFSHFLALINAESASEADLETVAGSATQNPPEHGPVYWKGVQDSLIQSQWAKQYRTRAIAVIAMLDPGYADDPSAAEQRVGLTLRPAVVHRPRGRSVRTRQVSSIAQGRTRKAGRTRARNKRRA
jgi:hypothetical protein